MTFAIVPIVAAAVLFYALMFGVNGSVHKQMTIENSAKGWGYGTETDFWREFSKHKWSGLSSFPHSFFGGPDTEIHASVIQFNGRGMVLNPIAFWRVSRKLKRRYNRPTVCWSEKSRA